MTGRRTEYSQGHRVTDKNSRRRCLRHHYGALVGIVRQDNGRYHCRLTRSICYRWGIQCLLSANLMMTIHIELIQRALGFAELDHAGLEVVERTLYQAAVLFVVGQKVMP